MQEIKPEKVQKNGAVVEDYWKAALKMLSDVKFLDSLLNFDKDNIPDEVMEVLRTQYFTKPDFDPEKMKRVSTACEGLCRWVLAMSDYHDVIKIVKPKQIALAIAEEAYRIALAKLNELREQLRQVQVIYYYF